MTKQERNKLAAEQALTRKKRRYRSNGYHVAMRFFKNKGAVVGLTLVAILALMAITCPLWIDYDTQVVGENVLERLQWPSGKHWFGTDDLGRDLFSRIIWGSRVSLSIGVIACLVSFIIGVPIGALCGYYGQRVDMVVMRVVDVFASIPDILMGVVVVAILGVNTINLMLAVGISSIPAFVKITRAAVMTVKNQEYVEACRALGKSDAYIIFKHIIPNCLSPIVVQASLRMASAVISASSLSFLGLGVQPPSPEWGALLSAGRIYIRGYAYLTAFPGMMICITVVAFNLIGDALRDAMDPKLKR
ncbi:MAG: ABC transporter permease [Clostridia bacterium]|nr:ABC transporter permease [Clostridia bacterium]